MEPKLNKQGEKKVNFPIGSAIVFMHPNEEKLTIYTTDDGTNLRKIKTLTLKEWVDKGFSLSNVRIDLID